MFGIGLGFVNGNTFSPTNVAGIHSYYTADICTQSGGTATVIPDQGPNHEASLLVISGNPLYNAADSQFNNKPSFSCVAAARRVEVTFNTPITQPSTYYMVMRCVSGASTVYYRSNQGNFTDSAGFYLSGGFLNIQTLDGGQSVGTGTITDGNYVSCCTYDSTGADSAIYLNNSATPVATAPGDGDIDANSNAVMTVGTFGGETGDYTWTAAIQYNGLHSLVTRKKIMKFLGDKYGITTT